MASRPILWVSERGERSPIGRPSLSPAIYVLAAAWVGVLFAQEMLLDVWFDVGQIPQLGNIAFIGCLPAVVLGGSAIACLRWKRLVRTPLVPIALGGLVGVLAGSLSVMATTTQTVSLMQKAPSAYTYVVESDPKRSDLGTLSMNATARLSPSKGRGIPVRLRMSSDVEGAGDVRMGSVITLVGRWSEHENDNWGRQAFEQGIAIDVRALKLTSQGWQRGPLGSIRRARAAMQRALPRDSPAASLVAGVVLGYTSDLSGSDLQDDFATLGLSHLIAVSGSHLAVVAALLGIIVRRARLRPQARLVVSGGVCALYVVLTGLQPSAIRSLCMVFCALGGRVLFRRAHALSALSVCALCLLVSCPTLGCSMGFQLSVLSVFGLCIFGRYASDLLSQLFPKRLPETLGETCALTVVAQACTLPITIPAFGIVSVLGPLANIVVGPLVSVALGAGVVLLPLSGALVCCGVPNAIAKVLLLPALLPSEIACRATSALVRIPFAAVPVSINPAPLAALAVLCCVALYIWWPHPNSATLRIALGVIACAVILVALVAALFAPTRLLMLDVGQGDAILIQDGLHAILIDTGPDDAIRDALGRAHVFRLDAVVLTHTDEDHAGGLDELPGIVSVKNVVLAKGVWNNLISEQDQLVDDVDRLTDRVLEVTAGSQLRVGDIAIEIIWPENDVMGSENEDSLVGVLSYPADQPRFHALLTGDAEDDVVGPLAETGLVGDVDILKVGHHGSAVSTSAQTLSWIEPEYALISAGAHNRYGHPRQECLDALNQAGCTVLCTAWCGDIEVRLRTKGYDVAYSKDSWGEGSVGASE